MKKTIYIITSDDAYDFELTIRPPEAFFSEQKARSRYMFLVNCAKNEYPENEYEWEEHDNSFCAYEDGRYSKEHYNVKIHKTIIDLNIDK